MHVEIWSDVACPWCYVGTQRFGRAVEETGVDVDVVYRSFELDPTGARRARQPAAGRLPRAEVRRPQPGAGRPRPPHRPPARSSGIDFRWSGHAAGQHLRRPPAAGVGAPRARRRPAASAEAAAAARVLHRRARRRRPRRAGRARRRRRPRPRTRPRRCSRPTPRPTSCTPSAPRPTSNGITAVPTFVIEGEWMLQGAHETEKWVKALTHITRRARHPEPPGRPAPRGRSA